MDLTPIYELRSRLKAAMIAGTNLLSEDFRLKRAVEAMQPLEAASPVFAKISQLSKALLSPDCPDTAGALLDAITLADAVLCTQGGVAVAEQLQPIQTASWGSAITNAPYSVVKTLVDALTSSGNGHYGYVMDTHREKPEVFEDYRVKAAMVQALGASYAELADQVSQWLKEDGEAILPLLYKGFDPKGKKEMVRRVRVIEAIAGAKANEFYKEQLPEAEKEIRQALIYALRHVPENVELLMELTKTEKGNMKKMAYWALAVQEGETVAEFWKAYWKKKPADAIAYMDGTTAEWVAPMVTEGLKELLLPWTDHLAAVKDKQLNQQQAELMLGYIRALLGKTGEGVCECYRLAAAIQDRLDKPLEGQKTNWEIRGVFSPMIPYSYNYFPYSFQEAMALTLYYSLLINPDSELEALAVELYEQKEKEGLGDYYLPAAVIAKLLGAEDCSDWIQGRLETGTLPGGKKIRKDRKEAMAEALEHVKWDESRKKYVLRMQWNSPVNGMEHIVIKEIRQPIEEKVTEVLMKYGNSRLDGVMYNWIQTENAEYCERMKAYFYKKCFVVADNAMYLALLKKCGATDCTNLAVHYCKGKGKVSYWDVTSYIGRMPGNREAKVEEAQRVYELLKSGEVKMNSKSLLEQLERYILELKS